MNLVKKITPGSGPQNSWKLPGKKRVQKVQRKRKQLGYKLIGNFWNRCWFQEFCKINLRMQTQKIFQLQKFRNENIWNQKRQMKSIFGANVLIIKMVLSKCANETQKL